MIFTQNFGVTSKVFTGQPHISYLRFGKAKTPLGYTIGDTTALDVSKRTAILKSYSEYLERVGMGMPIGEKNIRDCICWNGNLLKIQYSEFGYGNGVWGVNDTTGTASGVNTSRILEKAILELIEKNDSLCFWFSDCGNEIIINDHLQKYIKQQNFIADKYRLYMVNEISNYYTCIFFAFKDGRLVSTGVSCTNKLIVAAKNAIAEAKIIEWQQYNNPYSNYSSLTEEECKKIINRINTKKYIANIEHYQEKTSMVAFPDWVGKIAFAIINTDSHGIKTVKCVSESLLSCMPIKKNIEAALEKTVVKKYYKEKDLDCPIS